MRTRLPAWVLIMIIITAMLLPGMPAAAGALVAGAYDNRANEQDNDKLSPLELPDATSAPASSPECAIEAVPTATCSGWQIVFQGSSTTALNWRAKVGATTVASGTTKGNETVTGTWPAGIDLSQPQTFKAEV